MTFLLSRLVKKYPIATVVSSLLILSGCVDPGPEDTSKYAPGTKEGYELAKYHCSSCHSFVDASNLDSATWHDKTLPPMGKRLGITYWNNNYVDTRDNAIGGLTFKQWQQLVDYYLKSSPKKLTIPEPDVKPVADMAVFEVKAPAYRTDSSSRTVMSSIDTITGNIYTSDFSSKKLMKWNSRLELVDSLQLNSPMVSASFYSDKNRGNQGMFTSIGFLKPGNFQLGALVDISSNKKLSAHKDTIARQLARPVYTSMADMNNDGLNDWVISEFGHQVNGGLYIAEQQKNGTFEHKAVFEWPGATMTVVRDFNNDGWNDIMVLFAQDYESIKLYINNQDGSFTEKKIMSFLPVNGSSSFQLADFNKDGFDDILYTAGDNADVSTILKPYHGVYIFMNDGKNNYTQSFFYQINGCTKAIAEDFDKDGDLDIATIAFYADFENKPGEAFMYFEQTSPMKFKTYSPPVEKYGRWRTMEVADYDNDGDKDIILGNMTRDVYIEKKRSAIWDQHIPFILLENKTSKK